MVQDLNELADRCEAATGPDRELDAMIAVATDFRAEGSNPPSARDLHRAYGGSNEYADIGKHWPRLPAYTVSIDAAMTLVPDAVEIIEISRSKRGGLWTAYLNVSPTADVAADAGYAATPALAICTAALCAKAHPTGGDE